ncbi:protein translocase subunit SecF [Temperatibacter marinus]|uniref:Protein-export membrane protein SecF n=1 Tax=Temperatibacter marinus TaxID=1456591 RepID=A0AA52H9K6_9PROT|nr:protein translocase subunit SecF [Temperatibacter marinus]WND02617.1 protein translocase subunit SecF [Temperatibacter marinus]
MFFKYLMNTDIKFLAKRKIAMVVSILMIIASIGLFAGNGLNYGIDFKGGISIEVGTEDQVPMAQIRSTIGAMNLGDVSVQGFGSEGTEAIIRIESQPGGDSAQTRTIENVKLKLAEAIPGISIRQENVIGPNVSGELKQDGAIAVTVAVFMVLLYIWLRFEWQFGLGAVVALVHDVILTIGFFSITGLEFNLSIIAAILTIVGYSLNDTVVVYDRVRENIRRYRKKSLEEILDLSLNQTLIRTIMTSVTTLLALFALFFLGGPAIQGFTAAMIWGVVIGTYSSVFIASPVLMMFNLDMNAMIMDDEDDPTVDKSSNNPFENV